MDIRKVIRDWMLPIAMVTGASFYLLYHFTPSLHVAGPFLSGLAGVMQPVLIFAMLFLTFCRIEPKDLKPHRWHWWLLLIQGGVFAGLGMIAFMVMRRMPDGGHDWLVLLESAMLCFICPTATAAAVKTLREECLIPIIGIEPAIKPAAKLTRSGIIGVLATAGTLKGSKYHLSKSSYGKEVRILERVGEGFVELVESHDLDSPHAEEVVRRSLQPLLDQGADTIVLGCTHYPFLLSMMQKIAGPDVEFIDPSAAVARHLAEVLKEKEIGPHEGGPEIELISSASPEALEKFFKLIRSTDR